MAEYPYSPSLLSAPSFYQIRVVGRIDPKWADYLQGMAPSTVEGVDKVGFAITELSGRLPDQAALMGVLWQLYSLGVALISVRCRENEKQCNLGN